MRFRRVARRDPATPAEARRRARDLLGQWRENEERETLHVLADALLESDVPELGQDLAYALEGRDVRPGAKHGAPVPDVASSYANLRFALERADEELSWQFHADRAKYSQRERDSALHELREIDRDWGQLPRAEQREDITRVIEWLETPDGVVTLQERAGWLFNGTFGYGQQLLAREIASASRQSREAHLFRLVLGLDDRIAPAGVNRVWSLLSAGAKANVTGAMRNALREYGAVVR